MSDMALKISRASQQDLPAVLGLMRELADFEGYRAQFAVTLEVLEQQYVQHKTFGILVAKQAGANAKSTDIAGILVYFFQPFTYDLTPWLIVKELYVAAAYRGHCAGQALMLEAKRIGKAQGSSRMKWEVLTHNQAARQFYTQLGARVEDDWRTMSLSLSD
ncbi:GNAT family N-acetyltransferase [Aestuariibacter sp. GS-14]|uniref:GNAT family N-acetyltransferase n=1 Tax=Aestuariibacter sp. GS-14 TaxID=2590670 RepID=UPI0011283152|nr:GNAT family N-acetyltransferase [Aestuariibacter sp. GS-14]TPV52889.1 GNAT family N-acetyltransferase [Aestuariibacter sp. GS-14]